MVNRRGWPRLERNGSLEKTLATFSRNRALIASDFNVVNIKTRTRDNLWDTTTISSEVEGALQSNDASNVLRKLVATLILEMPFLRKASFHVHRIRRIALRNFAWDELQNYRKGGRASLNNKNIRIEWDPWRDSSRRGSYLLIYRGRARSWRAAGNKGASGAAWLISQCGEADCWNTGR